MPTENRSSNTEQMVSVPMGALEKCLRDANLVRFTCDKHVLLLQDLVSQPAAQHHAEVATAICRGCFTEQPKGVPCQTCAEVEAKRSAQHQGEPVAHMYRALHDGLDSFVCLGKPGASGPNYEAVPLYTHADAGEVERLREDRRLLNALCDERFHELSGLRAQLAERNALLLRITGSDHQDSLRAIGEAAALSASAEPSAPAELDQGIPGTSFQRLNMLANQGE
ncbi:hypothetical protein LOY34_17270 [Pseudomonas sp. B21-009]|uniref:hypothetical protein n=1 Tax=Pseudomonas sp. B21-009 TaxID=2895470 RepID=UPI00215EA07F|nr:hypothetical protein [Pseudomonas sp. B21-009]UVM65084.1 hypothetical protein LOY34_17270 [Pseudomonas sp. B21-009]